jgi:thioesterase domain-containing protein
MSDPPALPDRLNAQLRARFDRLSPEKQARILERLAESRRQRAGTRLALTQIRPASAGAQPGQAPLVIMPSMFGGVKEWRDFFGDATIDRVVYGIEIEGSQPYWKDEPTLEEIAAEAAALIGIELAGQRVHLAGYSFGGRLAFEVGQQMAAANAPPWSIVIIDTSATSRRRARGWRDVGSIASNLFPWIVNELSYYGPRHLGRRAWDRWRFRSGTGDDEHHDRLNQVFDLSRFPEVYQRRLRQSRQASAAYRPRVTQNRVFYLRSRIQSLIHAYQPDGGWGAIVPRELLTVRTLPSDHGSALHPRWREPLLGEIESALDSI